MNSGMPWPSDGGWEYPVDGESHQWGAPPHGPPPSAGHPYSGGDGGPHQWAAPPPPGRPPPPVGPPPPIGPPPPVGPPHPVGAPSPMGPPPSTGGPPLSGVLSVPGVPPTSGGPPSQGAPPSSFNHSASGGNHPSVQSFNFHGQPPYAPPTPGLPDFYPPISSNMSDHQHGPPPHGPFVAQPRLPAPASGSSHYPPGNPNMIHSQSLYSCPPPGSSAPQLGPSHSGSYNDGGYAWTGHPQYMSEFPQNGGPANVAARQDKGSSMSKEGWGNAEWGNHWSDKHRSYSKDMGGKSSQERSLVSSRSSYREGDGRGRDDRNFNSSNQERTSSSSSRYKEDRRSSESRYKDDRYGRSRRYPDMEDRWHRDQSDSQMRRSHSRSLPDHQRSRENKSEKRASPPHKKRGKECMERYDRGSSGRRSRSPRRRSRVSSLSCSPERKREHTAKEPTVEKLSCSTSSISRKSKRRRRSRSLDSSETKSDSKNDSNDNSMNNLSDSKSNPPPFSVSKGPEDVNVLKEEEEEEEEDGKDSWVRSAPADLYYQRGEK